MKTAILVDGGFYRKRAANLWGKKPPEKRALELIAYCNAHLHHEQKFDPTRSLYRIFYYDCPPLDKTIYHPLLQRGIDFRHSETFAWTVEFFNQLKQQRKVALRLGELSEENASFRLNDSKLKQLQQKGVDMKIGLDIASLAYQKNVDQIILIAGDSDFVPAAKHARREGIDFVLDPMWATIKDSLFEHIDGLHSEWGKQPQKKDS